MKKVGDGLPPFKLANGAMCVFKCVLQRPKEVVLEGLCEEGDGR